MKKVSTLICVGVLMSALCTAFVACNNEPNGEDELSDEQQRIELAKLTDDTYYVAGFNVQDVAIQADGTAKCGSYLFISENLQDTVSVYNRIRPVDGYPGKLFDGIFEFPAEIMYGSVCGFAFFPKEYRYAYPVKIHSHRAPKDDETLFSLCNAMIMVSDIEPNKFIVVESLSKIEP
jgi:hypothetical protein